MTKTEGDTYTVVDVERPAGLVRRMNNLGLKSFTSYATTITVVAALEFGVFSAFAPHFFSTSNVQSMAKITSYTLIVAIGITFLFIAAEIDLSIGANLAFTAVIFALAISSLHWSPWIAAGAALLVGAMIGAINGLVVTVFKVQSFIVTLGMLSVLGGASLIITGGLPVNLPSNLHTSLLSVANGVFFGIPAPAAWGGIILILGVFVLRYTKFGYHVYAVGGSVNASREMGVNVRLVKFLTFVLTGALCGIAAVLESSWLLQATPGTGDTFTLQAIAAMIVGGVSLYGGAGSAYGTLMGCIIMGMLGNGLVLLGLDANWPQLVQGIMIMLAVSLGLGLSKSASSRRNAMR